MTPPGLRYAVDKPKARAAALERQRLCFIAPPVMGGEDTDPHSLATRKFLAIVHKHEQAMHLRDYWSLAARMRRA